MVCEISGMANPGNIYVKYTGINIDIKDNTIEDIPILKFVGNNFLPNRNIDELYPIKNNTANTLCIG